MPPKKLVVLSKAGAVATCSFDYGLSWTQLEPSVPCSQQSPNGAEKISLTITLNAVNKKTAHIIIYRKYTVQSL